MITLLTVAFFLLSCHVALAEFITAPDQLTAEGAGFSWEEAKSRTIKIFIEGHDRENNLSRADIGSGFLISPDGLFVTAYHVMKYCLASEKGESGFAKKIDCATVDPRVRYKAQLGDRFYDIEMLSFGKAQESSNGKRTQTPDETIKQRDFVVGKLKGGDAARAALALVRLKRRLGSR